LKITRYHLLIVFIGIFSLNSCSEKKETKEDNSTIPNGNEQTYQSNQEEIDDNEYANDDTGCKYEDGSYDATVDYYNPETGYSATYTLEVEVQDCQIVQINFPNDGYLDEDHITYADIDENGEAYVYGEGGKTYEIQID
jgi:major membrane immunogen (membrane-anchored lipoprotein)